MFNYRIQSSKTNLDAILNCDQGPVSRTLLVLTELTVKRKILIKVNWGHFGALFVLDRTWAGRYLVQSALVLASLLTVMSFPRAFGIYSKKKRVLQIICSVQPGSVRWKATVSLLLWLNTFKSDSFANVKSRT